MPIAILLLALVLAFGCSNPGKPAGSEATMGSWTLVDPPAGPGAFAPSLTTGRQGALLTWLEPAGEPRGHRLLLSRLDGAAWSAPREVATGGDFFANWADRPAAAIAEDGSLIAHWLRMLGDDTYAYGVELARSSDGGESWRRLGLLHDDASPSEHGFVSYAPAAAGIHAFWLDGRRMTGDHGETGESGAMELRTTLLGDGPAPPSTLLDDRVCECCATDAALTSEGPIVVYRDRDRHEVRDVAIVRATDAGWSEPLIIHADGWEIRGCPVNGPAVAARGRRVAVAWFSAALGEPRVQAAFSDDAGATFGAPVLIDGELPLGRVDVALDDRGDAFVSWLGSAGAEAEIRFRRLAANGSMGAVGIVARTAAGRASGVPRMVATGRRLIFAWVEVSSDDSAPPGLRAAVLPLPPVAAAG